MYQKELNKLNLEWARVSYQIGHIYTYLVDKGKNVIHYWYSKDDV
jgi:hypothetical protein